MEKYQKLFRQLIEKVGPEELALMSIYFLDEISYLSKDYQEWENMANEEFKTLIKKFYKAGETIESHKNVEFKNVDLGYFINRFINQNHHLTILEGVSRYNILYQKFLEEKQLILSNKNSPIILPEPYHNLIDDSNFRNDTEKIAMAIVGLQLYLEKQLKEAVLNRIELDEDKAWEVIKSALENDPKLFDEEKESVCPGCQSSPCMCSDPFN